MWNPKFLGISDVQARSYVRKHAQSRVKARLQMATAILAATTRIRKSPAAYAWDILTDESGKYSYVPQPDPALPEATSVQPAVLEAAKVASEVDLNARIQAVRQLAPDEQWVQHRASLKLLLSKHLGSELWKVLELRCMTGAIGASVLLGEVNAAIATLEIQSYVEQLREELSAIHE